MYSSTAIMPPPIVSCPDYLIRERSYACSKKVAMLHDHVSQLIRPLDVELDEYISSNLIGSLIAIGTIQHSEDLAKRDIPFYMCNYCDFKTVQRVDMIKHLDTHRFGCKFCEYEIFSRAEVIRHTVKCHKEELKNELLRYCVLAGDKEFKRETSEGYDLRSKRGFLHSDEKEEHEREDMDDSMFDDDDDEEDVAITITQNEGFNHAGLHSGYTSNINKSYVSNQTNYPEYSRQEGQVAINSDRQSMINYSYENHNQNTTGDTLVFDIQGQRLSTSDFSNPQYFHTSSDPTSQKPFSQGLPHNYEQDMQINRIKDQSYANILEYVPKIVNSEETETRDQFVDEMEGRSSSVSSIDSLQTSLKQELNQKTSSPMVKEIGNLNSRVHKGMKPKTKRKDLSIGERYKVVQLLDQKMSQSAISKRLSCSQSQVSRISNNKEKIINLYEQKTNQDRRRLRTGKAADIETALTNWVVEARAQKLLVTGPILLEKAKDLARELNHEGFRPSNGWLSRWKERNNLSFSVRASRKPQKPLFDDEL